MPSCGVSGCKNKNQNTKEKNINYFSFPKNEETALKWMQACNRKVNLKNACICSVHFTPNCYKPKSAYLENCENYSPKKVRKLYDHAIPTENLPVNEKEVLKKVQNQQSIINVSNGNNSKNNFSENVIDTSVENKTETCVMQSVQENTRIIDMDVSTLNLSSDNNIVQVSRKSVENITYNANANDTNTQSNSQIIMSEQLRHQEQFIQALVKNLSKTKKENELLKKQLKQCQTQKTKVTKHNKKKCS